MEQLKIDKKSLRRFGITICIIFALIGIIATSRYINRALFAYAISFVFFISALFTPLLLRPVYVLWMRLAYLLNWINTRLILIIIFYLVLSPIGIAMKALGKDPLDRKFNKDGKTYWNKKEKKEFSSLDYEKQF